MPPPYHPSEEVFHKAESWPDILDTSHGKSERFLFIAGCACKQLNRTRATGSFSHSAKYLELSGKFLLSHKPLIKL